MWVNHWKDAWPVSTLRLRLRVRSQQPDPFARPGWFCGADNSPLIVINGLPLDQGVRNAEGAGQQRDRGDNLANINPDDIESITVLGRRLQPVRIRAARGAIIITTKSGQRTRVSVLTLPPAIQLPQPWNFWTKSRKRNTAGTGR